MSAEVELSRDRRQELVDERDFLLASLTDLETEYAAGDLDDADYAVLKDGYTARTAEVLRELAADAEPVSSRKRARWKSWAIGVGSAVVLFGVLWWALSSFLAQRLPDQSMTGLDPRSERQQLLSQARAAQFERPEEAAAIYAMVLDDYPNDVEALTYGGWTRALAVRRNPNIAPDQQVAELSAAGEMLSSAIEIDPTYPDPLCLRGVLFTRFLDRPDLGADDLDACLALDPPADVRGLVEGLRTRVAASTTVPGG